MGGHGMIRIRIHLRVTCEGTFSAQGESFIVEAPKPAMATQVITGPHEITNTGDSNVIDAGTETRLGCREM